MSKSIKEMNAFRLLASFTAMTAAAVICGSAALADDDEGEGPKGPRLEADITIELQSDNTFDSDDENAEISDTYNTTEAELAFYVTDAFSVQAGLVFEPVLDTEDDRFFSDHGLFVEQLYAQYGRGGFKIFAGKFNPTFGKAYDATPGVYGTDFAEDGYELTEKVGFGASVTQTVAGLAQFELTGTLYQQDTSGLSDSAFTRRGILDEDDGGVSNTDSLESFTVILDAREIAALPGISAQIGYRHQAAGFFDEDQVELFGDDFAGRRAEDEHGFVAGLYGEHEWNSVKFSWIGEAVYLENYQGTNDEIWFYTVGAEIRSNKWFASAAATFAPREADGVDADGFDLEDFEDDKQITFTVGRELRDDLEIGVGYKYDTVEDIDSHTVGVLLTKAISFNNAASGLK